MFGIFLRGILVRQPQWFAVPIHVPLIMWDVCASLPCKFITMSQSYRISKPASEAAQSAEAGLVYPAGSHLELTVGSLYSTTLCKQTSL